MTHREKYATDAWQQLANRLARLEETVSGLRARALRVPILDADAATGDPANVWAFSDKRVRVRLDDGTMIELRSAGDDTQQLVKTYNTNPSAGSGVTLWLHGGTGELRGRLANGTVQRFTPQVAATSSDTAAPADVPTSAVLKPTQTQLATFSKTYAATWGMTYNGDDSQQASDPLQFGQPPGWWNMPGSGERKSMIGFNDAQIRSDAAGATVKLVELQLTLAVQLYASLDVHVGTHNVTAAPATYTPLQVNVSTMQLRSSRTVWVPISTAIGVALRDNVCKGLVLDQPSSSGTLYGAAQGGSSPKLRVTYVR